MRISSLPIAEVVSYFKMMQIVVPIRFLHTSASPITSRTRWEGPTRVLLSGSHLPAPSNHNRADSGPRKLRIYGNISDHRIEGRIYIYRSRQCPAGVPNLRALLVLLPHFYIKILVT